MTWGGRGELEETICGGTGEVEALIDLGRGDGVERMRLTELTERGNWS